MTVVNVPTRQYPFIQPGRHVQNGKAVRATVELDMRRVANQLVAHRTREQFVAPGVCAPIPGSSTTDVERWRYYTKTGPFTTRIRIDVILARQKAVLVGDFEFIGTDPHVEFTLTDDNVGPVGSLEFHPGPVVAVTDAPSEWTHMVGFLDVDPSTEYHGVFELVDHGRIVTATVTELAADPDTDNGYLAPAPAAGANIYAADRENLAAIANAFPDVGRQLLNLSTSDDATGFSTSSGTGVNLIDLASTDFDADVPGVWIDLAGKDLSRWGGEVPVAFWAFGRRTGTTGSVDLVDSTGSPIATIALGPTFTWHATTVNLPATEDKYFITLRATGGAAQVLHVSLYEVAP